jgi:sphingomyelin phosphodiesterase
MLYHSFTWLLVGALAVQKSIAEPLFHQQVPISTAEIIETAHEAAVFQATTDLLSSESFVTSCSSCISLLQVVKNLAYISESLFLSTLTSVCKRAGIDPIVVSMFAKSPCKEG